MTRTTIALTVAALAALAGCAGTSSSSTAPDATSKSSSGSASTSTVYATMQPNLADLKAGGTRSFHVKYVGKVSEIPAGTKLLRVWMPVPQSTQVQTIADLEFSGAKGTINTEKKFGNKVAYFEIPNPGTTADITMEFNFTRAEQVTDLDRVRTDGAETDPKAATFLKDDKLTIVDDRIRKMAADVTKGKTTTTDKAKAIYDHVMNHMKYDKPEPNKGWGKGDTNFACDAGYGNCTDFHALFMSLCRASGIPAGFEIGLYFPYDKGKVETPGGYHCWSFYRVPGKTWVPVDISEADRFPERAKYFFGSHTPNRVTLSVGRDLVLEPAQAGAPINYMLNPYAEADGKAVKATKVWEYKEL